jgi:anthranilate synthase component 2
VERKNLPRHLTVTAETGDGLIMGLAHTELPVHGVQFHPESIASEHGHKILKNFLEIAAAWNLSTGRRSATGQPVRLAPALMAEPNKASPQWAN